MSWELFVGLRYLRSRRSEAFVSVITLISTLGVLLGVMVLTMTLAIMTGFEEDLRARILGLHPHLRVTSRLGTGSTCDTVGSARMQLRTPLATPVGSESVRRASSRAATRNSQSPA